MIFSSKDNLEKSNIKLFSIFILVIHLNSCSSIFSMLEDNGDQNSTLKTIEEKCVNVETSAIAMEKKNIQDRSAKGLSEIARALEACRTEIESSLQPDIARQARSMQTCTCRAGRSFVSNNA
jgi:dsDNA-specific endonuclease/ATPase MutS2